MAKMDEYKQIFMNELTEYIESLNKLVLDLERDGARISLAEEIMRIAHSIKGMAAAMEYQSLANISHEVETLLNREIERGIVRAEVIDPLFIYVDKLQEFAQLVEIGQDIGEVDVGDLLEKVANLDEISINLGRRLELVVRIDPSARMKSVRAFMVLQNLEKLSKVLSSKPTKEELDSGAIFDELIVDILTKEDENAVRENVLTVTDVLDVTINYLTQDQEEEEESLEEKGSRDIQSVRVSLADLDDVMNLLAELMIIRGTLGTGSELSEGIKSSGEILGRMDGIIFELQERVLSLRMVPLDHVFSRFPRMVRDLAHSEGKRVELSILGKHIELDRSVIDTFNEILLHLVRNAVSHGIETPERRNMLSKPDIGKIRIVARQERDGIQVDMEDDGAGINMDAIRQKAVDKGLISADHTPSRGELTRLIFTSGFSTREETSQVSGRGYGLNVVWKSLDKINGNISIRTKKNVGTQFSIKLPLTIAITQALLVEDHGQKFAVPLNNVQSILRVQKEKILKNAGRKYIVMAGQIVPLIELYRAMTHNGEDGEEDVDFQTVIIWEKGERKLGLSVENLLGQQDIVIKDLDAVVSQVRGFSGASILGEGEIVLIIDPQILSEAY